MTTEKPVWKMTEEEISAAMEKFEEIIDEIEQEAGDVVGAFEYGSCITGHQRAVRAAKEKAMWMFRDAVSKC